MLHATAATTAVTDPLTDTSPDVPTAPKGRVASLDQFRGYTVAGMVLVNFLGGYAVVPAVLKHHNTYCSYADTIMPQFFFAVGFAYRLTFLKRLRQEGAFAASAAAVRRNLGLVLIGFVLYHLDGGAKTWAELVALGPGGFLASAFQRMVFQTLVHIALASLWVLPVIAAGPAVRVGYMVASAVLHLGLSWWFYFDWAWNRPVIDGGPLGFLSWSIPLLAGSLAYDVVFGDGTGKLRRLLAAAVGLMAAGYGLSCLGGAPAATPFVAPGGPVNLWTMSQRTGSISYLTFSAGFSLAIYALFVVLCDRGGWQVGIFRTFGRNALAAYVLHMLVDDAVKPYVPRDAPGWYVAAGFLLYFGITYVLVRGLERQGVFIRM
jgi:predicted acyltransferase